MEPDIRMLDKYKAELKDMDRNISLLQSKLHGVGNSDIYILQRSPGPDVQNVPVIWPQSNESNCEKQEKFFKGKIVILTVQCLIPYQYPVDLLTYLDLY